ncbi:MAG: hypothetical protein M9891_15505 [Austwickia sp.]|nr:hypothetical protein [Austwickia sp.]MCO5310657.1 hypothetical protein [Austwickia sp.]
MQTHLVTGPGGAGVSTVAAALAITLATAPPQAGGAGSAGSAGGTGGVGAAVTLACIGDDGSLHRLMGSDHAVSVVDLAAPRPWGELDTMLAATVDRYGGDGDVAEEWRRLPGADLLAALVALGEMIPTTDILIVDLGDLRQAGRLLGATVRTPWVLRGLLGLQAVSARLVGPAAGHAVPRWLDALEATADVVRSGQTRLHVVTGSGALAEAKTRRAVPPLLLSGVGPGLVIAPATDPIAAAEPGRWAPFVPVATAAWAADADGRLRADLAEVTAPLLAALPRLVETPAQVLRAADHLTWRVPLPWVSADAVQVEHRGEDLIVTVYDVPHLVLPPAVVRRCTPVRARLDGTYLEVESVLRDGAWRPPRTARETP